MSLAKEDYVRAGYRLPARHLVDQANATLKLVANDLEALKSEELLDDGEVKAAEGLVSVVDAGGKDRTLAEAEAKAGTGVQDDLVRTLKIQRRRLVKVGPRALRGTTDLDKFTAGTSRGSSIPKLKEDVKEKLALVEKNAEAFKKKGASVKFVTQVKKTLADLEAADAAQETALKSLPVKTRDFCESKGKLYFAVKDLNAAGQALYADDAKKAAQYSMEVLYRRGKGKEKGQEKGQAKGREGTQPAS